MTGDSFFGGFMILACNRPWKVQRSDSGLLACPSYSVLPIDRVIVHSTLWASDRVIELHRRYAMTMATIALRFDAIDSDRSHPLLAAAS